LAQIRFLEDEENVLDRVLLEAVDTPALLLVLALGLERDALVVLGVREVDILDGGRARQLHLRVDVVPALLHELPEVTSDEAERNHQHDAHFDAPVDKTDFLGHFKHALDENHAHHWWAISAGQRVEDATTRW